MRIPRRGALALLVLLACGGEEGGRGGKAGKPVATDVSAADLYRDYSALRGAELLEAYQRGVTVTGTVSRAVELGEEGLQLWLAVERGAVALAFADLGVAARQKGVRAGTLVRARCQVGGKPQETLFLSACALQ